MKTMDKASAIEWLSLRNVTDARGGILPFHSMRKTTYHIPADSGRRTAIARELALRFGRFDEWVLWIDEFGIWPSAENRHLFDSFRLSLGESRSLQERPGHVLAQSDVDVAFSLLSMVLYFSWGAVLAPSSGSLVVRISHDELIDVWAGDSGSSDSLLAALANITGNSVA